MIVPHACPDQVLGWCGALMVCTTPKGWKRRSRDQPLGSLAADVYETTKGRGSRAREQQLGSIGSLLLVCTTLLKAGEAGQESST